jgi:hypothetical protein
MVSTITRLDNAEKIAEKRRGESMTYTEPLPENDRSVELYQAEFYRKQLVTSSSLKAMQEELRQYPHTLGDHYKLLVPNTVSFDQFFCRYYYRCSIERVVDELRLEEGKAVNNSNCNDVNNKDSTNTGNNNNINILNIKNNDLETDFVDDLSFFGNDEEVSDSES